VQTVCTLTMLRLTPDDLVSGIGWNKRKAEDDGYEYRFVANGMTSGELRSEFGQYLPNVSVRIQSHDGVPFSMMSRSRPEPGCFWSLRTNTSISTRSGCRMT